MKPFKLDNKKRRIQKKLFLGEFAMLGFEVSCDTKIQDFENYDTFVYEFIDYIDALDLSFGGGGLELFEGFICHARRYESVTEQQQAEIVTWLEKRNDVKAVRVGELVDANYF
ncbi:50S ribosome-binding protein YggL [Vibrio pectenicida]|uniref:50S ribosome-binding protein YggL n=1 Tax=Vibrio pectenicida TaxID=62763 RepID=UPI003B9B343F